MDYFCINTTEYDNAVYKNSLIPLSNDERIVFIHGNVTNNEEIEQIFESNSFLNDMNVVVFGEDIPDGEIVLEDAVSMLGSSYYALVVKKAVFTEIGCFNEKLVGGSTYEFLCRAVSLGDVYCIPCGAEDGSNVCIENVSSHTSAYVMRRYMSELKNKGMLENTFNTVLSYMSSSRNADFQNVLSMYLNDIKAYENIAINTAPIFVISGDDTCVGVLRDFADSLADELVCMGQAVITTNKRYGHYDGMGSISEMLMKAYVGFQIPALESDFFRNRCGKKIQFWFDNPLFFDDMFHNLDDKYYVLCQDAGYAEHLTKYYGVQHALQFPPAGRALEELSDSIREYDVVFIGGFNKLEQVEFNSELQKDFYNYMMMHPEKTFEDGYKDYLLEAGVCLEDDKLLTNLKSMKSVFGKVINEYRRKIVDAIVENGIQLHVYGTSWNAYEGPGKNNLIIHPEVSVDESLEILGKSKIGLNIMTWHKAGMTERVANIMLSGAVCVSDETTYLKQNFDQNQEIVLFSLNHLEEVPIKIKSLLENEDIRNCIANNAYKKASEYHLWKHRAKELISLVDE